MAEGEEALFAESQRVMPDFIDTLMCGCGGNVYAVCVTNKRIIVQHDKRLDSLSHSPPLPHSSLHWLASMIGRFIDQHESTSMPPSSLSPSLSLSLPLSLPLSLRVTYLRHIHTYTPHTSKDRCLFGTTVLTTNEESYFIKNVHKANLNTDGSLNVGFTTLHSAEML